jgi:hypothetical protein
MSMEIIFVLAAATGRTLVLPPKAPFYLLAHGKQGARAFGNFFNLQEMHSSVKIMTMKDFVQKHGQELLGLERAEVAHLLPLADVCTYSATSDEEHCKNVFGHLRESGWQPPMQGMKDCLIFDERVFLNANATVPEDTLEHVQRFCGPERKVHYYDESWTKPRLLHWQAVELDTRLLNHFYAFTLFTEPVIDNWFKRFVRDYLHYNDQIYCAAAKIVAKLREESADGYFSTMHVRRGDFQFKEVKLPAEELYENTKEVWRPNEILFIATDEKNASFFDPIAKHHPIRILNDYWDVADLGSLDPTFLGMIDTIVASQGRTFVGTWFSTFTGYINRMRGYHGYSMKDSWYSWLERKTIVQKWTYPNGNYVAREWPIGWIGIDGDEIIEHELNYFPDPNAKFDVKKPTSALVGEHESIVTKDGRKLPKLAVSDLKPDTGFSEKPLARGIAGRSLSETPALIGGSRAHIQCGEINVDSLAYWNDPQGDEDASFQSPFAVKGETKYISFSPDRGGWNNVRMSMEIIFVIAAATGRTLVLPPEHNLYLLAVSLCRQKMHEGILLVLTFSLSTA